MLRRLLFYSAAVLAFASAIPCSAQTQGNRDACSANHTTVVISKAYYIDEVRFDGDTRLPKSELEAIAARLRPESWSAEDGAVERVAGNARGEWQDRGYFRAEVKASAEQLSHDPTSEHVAVILHVNAGRRYKTGEMRIVTDDGKPPVIPFDELRHLIPLGQGEIFDTSKLREGFDNLSRRYGAIGYINFTSLPEFDVNDEEGVVNLTVRLSQGMQYRVGEVEIKGLEARAESDLRSLMPIGEIFNSTKVREFLAENPDLPARVLGTASLYERDDAAFVTITYQGCPQ